MTPEQLKASILQYAIQGRLVEQYPNDEIVSIASSFSGDASNLFEIPEKWKWLSIKDVASVNTGLSFKKQDQRNSSNGSLRVLRGGNIGDDYKYHLYEDDIYVDLEQFQTKYIQLVVGDVIMPSVTSMEKICKTGFVDCDLPAITAGGFVYIIRCIDKAIIDSKYLLYFISSSFNKEQCKPNIHKSGQAFYNLKKTGFIEQPICVPPLAEQHRIVAKIEELLPYVDRYAAAYEKLEQFNAKFPEDMKKSILQYAIQGKLVEQRPEEGTGAELYKQMQAEKQRLIKEKKIKKEKPLAEITDDEIPFDIPETWLWIRVGDVGFWGSGATPPRTNPAYYGGSIPWLKTGDLNDGFIKEVPEFITELALEKTSVRLNPVGSVLMAMYGATIGKLGILEIPVTTNQACCACIPYVGMYNKYLFYYLMSMRQTYLGMAEGGAQPNISKEKIVNSILPLPPLAEQKRIVAKLEEILPLCERLK